MVLGVSSQCWDRLSVLEWDAVPDVGSRLRWKFGGAIFEAIARRKRQVSLGDSVRGVSVLKGACVRRYRGFNK